MTSRIGRRPDTRAAFQRSRGYQICVSCFHGSAIVATRRCPDCDREVCTLCVVRIDESSEYVCPDCALERQVE